MNSEYENNAKILKALSDPNRLKILDLLSCGEKCGCEVLESFDFTQPTLSHHMKVLIEAGVVTARKEGKWQYYSLVTENIEEFQELIHQILNTKQKEGVM